MVAFHVFYRPRKYTGCVKQSVTAGFLVHLRRYFFLLFTNKTTFFELFNREQWGGVDYLTHRSKRFYSMVENMTFFLQGKYPKCNTQILLKLWLLIEPVPRKITVKKFLAEIHFSV